MHIGLYIPDRSSKETAVQKTEQKHAYLKHNAVSVNPTGYFFYDSVFWLKVFNGRDKVFVFGWSGI